MATIVIGEVTRCPMPTVGLFNLTAGPKFDRWALTASYPGVTYTFWYDSEETIQRDYELLEPFALYARAH